MRRCTLFLVLSLTLLTVACARSPQDFPEALVYKTPTCGCCGIYAEEMAKEGYPVKTIDLRDLSDIKRRHGIPQQVWDCHTVLIGDYFLEGHVPFAAVRKLLDEKPEIAGLALPNMPTGTPGMPGPKQGPFIVLQVDENGKYSEYGRY